MKRRADGRLVKVMKYKKLDGTYDRKWFYGKSEDDIANQIKDFKYELQAGRYFKVIAEEWEAEHFPTLEYNTLKPYRLLMHIFSDSPRRVMREKPSRISLL